MRGARPGDGAPDYSGYEVSGGQFEHGTIGEWAQDALTVIDRLTEGRLVLVGSSMGGWIGLLAALRQPERIAAIVGVATAPDFTERLMWDAMTFDERARITRDGILHVPSRYRAPTPVTKALIEDGRADLLLDKPIGLTCKVQAAARPPILMCHGNSLCAPPRG